MNPLRLLTLCAAATLCAAPVSLQQLLDASARSDAAKAGRFAAEAQQLKQRSEFLPGGLLLDAQAGYADTKDVSRSATEYHVAIEQPIRTVSSSELERLRSRGTDIDLTLRTARLQNRIYAYYVDVCTLQEELWLLEDARGRGRQMGSLIRTGMEGGEFDRSAWLRSRLNVQTLSTEILTLQSRHRETLLLLGAAAQTELTEPLCSDLPGTIPPPSAARFDDAPLLRQLENRLDAAKAESSYRAAWIPEVTFGVGYDDEMDLRRGSVYARIPLGRGSRQNNDLEAARRDTLAAAAELGALRTDLGARIEAFASAQQTRRLNLQRLNDMLIPEAYETTELLRERFMGSEASYLEYIDSQKALFALLMEGVQLRASALKAEAALCAELGMTPPLTKEEK